MQSSPPRPVSRRSQSSGKASHYTLDLEALDLDSGSETSTSIPQRQVEHVYSEDINGPSDFTINMEKWLRSDSLVKDDPVAPMHALVDPSETKRSPRPANTLLRDDAETAHDDEDFEVDKFQPNATGLSSESDDDAASSEWDPQESSSTPYRKDQDRAHPEAGQIGVSELTPESIVAPTVLPISEMQPQTPGSVKDETENEVNDSPRHHLSHINTQGNPKSSNEAELQAQIQKLQTKCLQLENLNQNLAQSLEHERAEHERRSAELISRESEMSNMKDVAVRRADEAEAKVANLVRQSQDSSMDNDVAASVDRLRKDLEWARRSRDEANERAKGFQSEMQELRDWHEADLARLKLELQRAEEAGALAGDLDAQLRAAQQDKTKMERAKVQAEQTAARAVAQVEEITKDHKTTTNELTSDYNKAVELAEVLRKKMKELHEQLRDDQAEHETEMERMRQLQTANNQAQEAEIEDLRDTIETKHSLYNDVVIERDAVQDSLDRVRAELEQLKTEMEPLQRQVADSKTINDALDARISETMQRRENKWRARLAESEKERQLMAQALMHQWGREDVGAASPQLYEYKYLSRHPEPNETRAAG